MDRYLLDGIRNIINNHALLEGINQTKLPTLKCIKTETVGFRLSVVYEPCLCLILRGAKVLSLGAEQCRYQAGEYLVVPVHLPAVGIVTEASPENPYLNLLVEIDIPLLREIIMEMGTTEAFPGTVTRALRVANMDNPFGEALLRLAGLMDNPADAPFLSKVYTREVYYRLLMSSQAGQVMRLVAVGGTMQRIAKVASHINTHFREPLAMTDLAKMASMSLSTFHQHFKEITSFTPLQFQKRLRLIEARRIMSVEATSATNAAYRVGYESPAQFTREYARMFGAPPGRDMDAIRNNARAFVVSL